MIERRRDYTKRAPSKDAGKIYVICEGAASEKDYYAFFEGLSSNLQLIVIPPEDGTDPLKLMALAKRKLLEDERLYTLDFQQNDKVWFAIDTDTWEKEGKIEVLRNFCRQQNKRIYDEFDEIKPYEAWNVAQSNPCFEIWLYYHYYDIEPDEEKLKAQPSMKAYVDGEISGGFDYEKDQVRLKDAIYNSEKNFRLQENGNPALFSTEQHLLGKEILKFVEPELRKLRNKMP